MSRSPSGHLPGLARASVLAGAAAQLLLLGCSVAPAYRSPTMAAPPSFRESGQVDTAAARTVWPARDWWHAFGSPRLDALIAEAERNNDDLKAAAARIEEADAQVRIAGAPLLPSLAATGLAQRARVQSAAGPALGNAFYPSIGASYELDFWGKNRALRAAALAAARGSRYDRETVALTLISSVARTYFQVLELDDRLRVARQNLANGEQILHGLTSEQTAGTATGLDVAQQDTAVALLYAAIPPLEEQYRQNVYALALLLGRMPESLDAGSGSLGELAIPEVAGGLPSELLQRRPDVASAEEDLIAANANIGAARAALFPSIVLTAGGGYESSMLASLINPVNRVYALAGTVTQPIFEGGALRGQLAYNRARYAELLADYHKTVITALSDVESALVAAAQSAEQQRRQQEAVDKARKAYEYSQTQLQAGTVNVLTVLNTENALFSAQDALVQIQYAHLQALIDLYTALGGGWKRA
ncbi:MAG TPA: efflux transporter outer membrane subunit [Steroidobacteraceae bacterium]|nr:efflux transporter outer membrane subunit [Steroidobacteraceae bacterium]